jgi:hypothetical protein
LEADERQDLANPKARKAREEGLAGRGGGGGREGEREERERERERERDSHRCLTWIISKN